MALILALEWIANHSRDDGPSHAQLSEGAHSARYAAGVKSLTNPLELAQPLLALRAGDTPVVWKLDRLGRSLRHLVTTIAELGERGINFRSLSDPIDTASAGGRLVPHIMAALAEFERSLIVERTRAGILSAKRRGRKLGRRRSLSRSQIEHARRLVDAGESPGGVAKSFGVARSTLYVSLRKD